MTQSSGAGLTKPGCPDVKSLLDFRQHVRRRTVVPALERNHKPPDRSQGEDAQQTDTATQPAINATTLFGRPAQPQGW
jgi:hypothetical protein